MIESKYLIHSSSNHLYQVWSDMKRRCYNKNDSHYERYGKRGITICSEWLLDFDNFAKWAVTHGYRYIDCEYGEKCSIDRIDVDGNYEPSNCQIITVRENAGKDKIGKKESIETRQKKSLSKIGINNSFYNHHHTEDTRKKISLSNIGKNTKYTYLMYDNNWNLLEVFNSMQEVKNYFMNKFGKVINESCIRQTAKGLYGRTQAYGYKWGYKLCK